MAVRKINYKDKSPLQTKPEIPEENKVNASDLNEIKEVVNNNADEIESRQLKEEGKGLSKNDFTDELKVKLESLNNYNDTEIKKEISEINKKVAENTGNDIKQDNEIATLKNNYTNLQEQNTKLESQIKKDRENMINLEVEGQSIHIEDSSDLEGKLEVLGNVEQETREGYNILENILTDKTVNGITVKINKDKSITLNGTATSNTSLDITKNFTITEESVFSGMCDGYGYNKMIVQIQGTDYNVNITNATPQVLQPKDNVKARIYIYAGTSITNALIKPQINKGTVAKPYEQYGASPSPEFPSVIRAVGDNINLLKNTAKTLTTNGITFTVNTDGTVTANGTATSLAQISLVANVKLPAGTYTIKDGKAYVESTEFNDWFDGLNNPSTLTFNTEVLLKNVYIQVKQGETVNNKIFSPKLEKGTEATSYSKFGQGSVGIKKQTQNILSLTELPATIDGITVNKNSGKIVLNGTTTKQNDKYKIGTFNTRENRNYILSITNKVNGLGFNANFNTIGLTADFNITKTGSKLTGKSMTTNAGKVELYMAFNKDITFNNLEIGIMVEEDKETGEFVEHQEQTKILPIQKPMLEGDYFIKEADGWKEVHGWGEVKLTGTENWTASTLIVAGYFGTYLKIQDVPKNTELYCNYFKKRQAEDWHKLVAQNFIYAENGSIGIRINNKFCENLESFKNWLKSKNDLENSVYVYYKKETLTKLSCTPEQTKILDELDNFQTYKPVTNITTDSIAKLKLKYIADTKTYIDNKTSNLEQQLNTINQLLSTTRTSSVLLDNLQSDIESEVL